MNPEPRGLDPRAPPDFDRTLLALSLTAAALAAVASAVALVVPGFYHRDPLALQPQALGQDAFTLLVAAPLLVASAWLAARGSVRAHVAAAGLLMYMTYAYATYAFGVRFNGLFLVYVAALGTSAFGLFLALARLPVAELSASAWARLPRRSVAALLFVTAGVFAALWLADIVPAHLSGGVPQGALEAATPTSPIHVLDLAFVLPLLVVAGVLLARRRPIGALLAGVMLVKAATISAAVLSMVAFVLVDGGPVNVPVAVAMVVVFAIVLLVGARHFAALRPEPAAPRVRRAAGGAAR